MSFDEWSTQRRTAAAAKPAAFTEGTGEHHVGEAGQLAPAGRISDAPIQRSDAVAAPPRSRPREQSAASADLPEFQSTPERRLSEKTAPAGVPSGLPRAPIPTSATPSILSLMPAYLDDVQKAVVLAEVFPPRTGPRRRRR